jgi:hypothetical protein
MTREETEEVARIKNELMPKWAKQLKKIKDEV